MLAEKQDGDIPTGMLLIRATAFRLMQTLPGLNWDVMLLLVHARLREKFPSWCHGKLQTPAPSHLKLTCGPDALPEQIKIWENVFRDNRWWWKRKKNAVRLETNVPWSRATGPATTVILQTITPTSISSSMLSLDITRYTCPWNVLRGSIVLGGSAKALLYSAGAEW